MATDKHRARPNEKQRPRGLLPDELRVHGLEACRRLFVKRPADIVRVYFNESLAKEFADIVRWCVENRKAYHAVNDHELENISGSVHHEGICFVAKGLPPASLDEALKSTGPLLWLDGVQNPQNVGAILRSAAHFGVAYVLGEPTVLTRLAPSAIRVAEGAAESVRLVPVPVVREGLAALKAAGYTAIATTSHKGQSIYQYRLPAKALFILGSEAKGISKGTFQAADQVVCIPGSGEVESLNVGVAAALCLGEHWRQHRGRPPRGR
jgi:RNA methyltransferase, TrmH family